MGEKETANKNLADYMKAWSDYNHAERLFLTAGENLRRTCDRLNGIPGKNLSPRRRGTRKEEK